METEPFLPLDRGKRGLNYSLIQVNTKWENHTEAETADTEKEEIQNQSNYVHNVVDIDCKIMSKFRTSQNAEIQKGETNSNEQITSPDKTCSMREILARSQRGVAVNTVVAESIYNPEFQLPDLRKLDFAEQQQLKEQIDEEFDSKKLSLSQLNKRKHELSEKIIAEQNAKSQASEET